MSAARGSRLHAVPESARLTGCAYRYPARVLLRRHFGRKPEWAWWALRCGAGGGGRRDGRARAPGGGDRGPGRHPECGGPACDRELPQLGPLSWTRPREGTRRGLLDLVEVRDETRLQCLARVVRRRGPREDLDRA